MKLYEYITDRKRQPFINLNVANLAKNHSPFLDQMDQMKSLPVHSGCVNTIEWNKTGEYILSGSDDKCLCITRPSCLFDRSKYYTVLQKILTTHLGNIFSAKFLPNTGDSLIASCSSEGPVIVTDVNAQDSSQAMFVFNCHTHSIFDVLPLPDDNNVFLSCSDDATVRLFDLRCHRSCSRSSTCPHPALIRNSHGISKIALHPMDSNLLLAGRADGKGLLYDRRKLPDPAKFSRESAHAERMADLTASSQKTFQFLHPLDGVVSKFCVPGLSNCRFTSLSFSNLGDQILASYARDDVYLFNYNKNSHVQLDKTYATTNTSANADGDEALDQPYEEAQDVISGTDPEDLLLEQARRKHLIRNKERRTRRPNRIRFDPDWSDTGVNSRPLYSASTSTNNDANNLSVSGGQSSATSNAMPDHRLQSIANIRAWIVSASGSETSASNSSASNNTDSNLNETNQIVESDEDEADETNEGEGGTHVYLNMENVNYDDINLDTTSSEDDEDNGDDEHIHESDTLTSPLNSRHDDLTRETITDSRVSNDDNNVTITRRSGQQSSLKRKSRETPPPPVAPIANPTNRFVFRPVSKDSERIRAETRLNFKKATDVLKARYKNIQTYHPINSYFGHRNRRTIIKQAEFWGDNYVMSGSDCGRIFFWDKDSCSVVTAFKADSKVVNRLAPNPHHYALASSGIDYDIKLWSTQSNEPSPLKPSKRETLRIIENNEAMVEEMTSTLTVPPQLFLSFLRTLTRDRRYLDG